MDTTNIEYELQKLRDEFESYKQVNDSALKDLFNMVDNLIDRFNESLEEE